MKHTRSQEIRVGIVTAIAVLCTVGAIIWGKGIGIGKNSHALGISFADASGVEIGTSVTVRGVRKGAVTSVKVRQADVLVTVVLDIDRDMLHSDATATIQMLELTGGKKIELTPGTQRAVLADGTEIRGSVPADIGAMVAGLDSIRMQVGGLLHRIDTAVTYANGYLGDRSLRYAITSTVTNVQDASAGLRSLVSENRGRISSAITALSGLVGDLRNFFSGATPKIDSALGSLNGVASQARTVMHTADGALLRADSLIARIDVVVSDLQNGQGALSKLIYDKKFAAELELTLKNARALVEEVRKYGININLSIGQKP